MQLIKRSILSKWNIKMIILFLPFLSIQVAFPNERMESELFVLSPGNEIILYRLKEGKIRGLKSLLPDGKWSNAYWPCYDKRNRILYFEAENRDFGLSRQIFSIKLGDKSNNPQKIVKGRRPSISPKGYTLAYYRHPGELWKMEIDSQSRIKILSDVSDYQPVVWISERILLYTDVNNHLIKFDIVSRKKEDTNFKFVIPAALSPDEDQILCGSYDGKKIFLYTNETNELRLLKKSTFFSIGSSFVWCNDGNSFLFTRQTFGNLIKFNEIRSLFLYQLDGSEQKLIDKFSLFGGVQIN